MQTGINIGITSNGDTYEDEQSSDGSLADNLMFDGSLRTTDVDDISDDTIEKGLHKIGKNGNNISGTGGNIQMAAKESAAVNRLKILVVVALVFPTFLIAGAVYFYTSNSEKNEFESQFRDDGAKVIDGIGKNVNLMMESTESLVVSIVSFAHNSNMTWPFVTLPDFYTRTSIIRSLAETAFLCIYPLVTPENRYKWEKYTKNNNDWVNTSIQIQEKDKNYEGPIIYDYDNWDVIYDNAEYELEEDEAGITGTNRTGENIDYFPSWQASPVIATYPPYNWDVASIANTEFLEKSINENRATITYPYLGDMYRDPTDENEIEESWYDLDWIKDYIGPDEEANEPVSDLTYPIIAESDGSNIYDGNYSASPDHKVVGVFSITYYWRDVLRGILPIGSNGIIVVMDTCLGPFTYRIDGPNTTYLGAGDHHDEKFESMGRKSSIVEMTSTPDSTYVPIDEDYCPYSIRVYPSEEFRNAHSSSNPIIFTIIAILIFNVLHTFVFLVYDKFVQRRNKLVVNQANRSRAIVNSLFPVNVAHHLLGESESSKYDHREEDHKNFAFKTSKMRLTSFLDGEKIDDTEDTTEVSIKRLEKPIAEVFIDTTVMISDICGFSVWASVREPTQVFALLESIYGAFDAIVDRRGGGVFKVETIGDSYVAVSGLPERRKNHASIMSIFAADCRNAFIRISRDLEVSLGPGTSDLSMRFGLSSGSLTAGVLRGKNARFQIFGNTVNLASRMESTGEGNMIHASKKTADLLIEAGKEHWLAERREKIDVKSFGTMQTYFVQPRKKSDINNPASTLGANGNDLTQSNDDDEGVVIPALILRKPRNDLQIERLVDWMVDLFITLIKNIIVNRPANLRKARKSYVCIDDKNDPKRNMVRDEVVEIIQLPEFNPNTPLFPAVAGTTNDSIDQIKLGNEVISQLRCYITQIALRYNNNAFHNFEHACQVTMATKKIFNRVVSPDDIEIEGEKDLHDSTYGITSDPLTQFAAVFSALIHDVDHPGIPNSQLVVEKTPVAIRYNNLSVSEQHSIDVAWDLLMDEEAYPHLRSCIFSNPTELLRFRQLVVNAVMATDIFDKELKEVRDTRWRKAFDYETMNETEVMVPASPLSQQDHVEMSLNNNNTPARISSNRRATIVIEHVIQASDIAHCMQHWKVYQKWNKRLFEEMHAAYVSGRSTKDPADSWYGGELWFFDNYIIPLAKKLKECGVFGVSCDEFLDYARDNRQEWEMKGQAIVLDMKKELMQEQEIKEHKEISSKEE